MLIPQDNDVEVLQVLMGMTEEGQSLRQSCQVVGISPGTFLRWVEADAEIAEQYVRARERLLDLKAEELEDIGERAAGAKTAVEVAGLRLLSDNRKWLLSKLAPKKYGEKVMQEVTGKDGGPIETHELSDAERAVRVAAFLTRAATP